MEIDFSGNARVELKNGGAVAGQVAEVDEAGNALLTAPSGKRAFVVGSKIRYFAYE